MSDPPKRRWFQFELADLFIGVTLIAIGLAGIASVFPDGWRFADMLLISGILYRSSALIGAGLLGPFKRKTVGLILGFMLIYPTLIFLGWLHTYFR